MTRREIRMSHKDDALRDEYDSKLIESGERGKYALKYTEGRNLVFIDPEMHELFPDSKSVNRALREYAQSKKQASGE